MFVSQFRFFHSLRNLVRHAYHSTGGLLNSSTNEDVHYYLVPFDFSESLVRHSLRSVIYSTKHIDSCVPFNTMTSSIMVIC